MKTECFNDSHKRCRQRSPARGKARNKPCENVWFVFIGLGLNPKQIFPVIQIKTWGTGLVRCSHWQPLPLGELDHDGFQQMNKIADFGQNSPRASAKMSQLQ